MKRRRRMLLSRAARLLITAYRYTLSPFLHLVGVRCRHEPSCSAYGLEAFKKHPPAKAAGLTAKRVLNCRPGGTWGNDPVP
ncbi:membrane protein insertion efficiency factor YidD [Parvularcula sp. ZS-1/3]|uniref:Putative membrane protein insertion efficiency factor n=2 Tax=Parvularcula mediterranea TaxID=2732508 RepID=A0A7Y3RNN2_9PROT|nr:membrane protein insertion efficiency factor YidD [Parvularcula mediterranea]